MGNSEPDTASAYLLEQKLKNEFLSAVVVLNPSMQEMQHLLKKKLTESATKTNHGFAYDKHWKSVILDRLTTAIQKSTYPQLINVWKTYQNMGTMEALTQLLTPPLANKAARAQRQDVPIMEKTD